MWIIPSLQPSSVGAPVIFNEITEAAKISYRFVNVSAIALYVSQLSTVPYYVLRILKSRVVLPIAKPITSIDKIITVNGIFIRQ